MPLFAYPLALVLGLGVGFVARKVSPAKRVNPGLVALGFVLALVAVQFVLVVQFARADADPHSVGYVVGIVIGRAGIPLVVAGMLASFMRE